MANQMKRGMETGSRLKPGKQNRAGCCLASAAIASKEKRPVSAGNTPGNEFIQFFTEKVNLKPDS